MSMFYSKTPANAPAAPSVQNSVVRPYNPSNNNSLVPPSGSKKIQQRHDPSFPNLYPNLGNSAIRESSQQMSQLRKSVPLANKQGEKQSWLTKCCSCAQLESYKKYFVVTNQIVLERALSNLQFWKNDFFTGGNQYDFYGPFWIMTTVIFCLSAVPNILLYQQMQYFQYDFQIVGIAFGYVYLINLIFPIILTFMLNLFHVECTYIQNICIYGYSLCTLIVCLLLCSINVCILHIVLIAYASVVKALFIMNNFNKGYQIPIAKKTLIMGLILGEAALQFFVVKIFFVNCVTKETSQGTTTTEQNTFFHQRIFQY